MSKYIVKNCPSITDGRNIQNICTNANACCELITDCLIKQVINVYRKSKNKIAKEILSYYEIEECE